MPESRFQIRHMDVPAAAGGERMGKVAPFPVRSSASGRMPESLLIQWYESRREPSHRLGVCHSRVAKA
jgi:hypothetical protein